MSHQHGKGQICKACMVRRSIITLFEREARDGDVEEWINGILDAAAAIGAAHVMPGCEANERAVLQEHIGISFDHFHRQQTINDAASAVKS